MPEVANTTMQAVGTGDVERLPCGCTRYVFSDEPVADGAARKREGRTHCVRCGKCVKHCGCHQSMRWNIGERVLVVDAALSGLVTGILLRPNGLVLYEVALWSNGQRMTLYLTDCELSDC